MKIVCQLCRAEYPLDTRAWVCTRCNGLLEIEGAPEFDPARINTGDSSLWRYRALLPLPEHAEPVTMGEGWTPFIPLSIANRQVYGKLDFMMPTGSFKDRGTTVLVSAARGLGVERVVEDSSGNAAASLAAYCARAKIRATIFAPAHASPNKLAQIRVYGAELRAIEGVREKSAEAAQDAVLNEGAYYASHYYNPFALFGMQTTAWEIWEQLGRAPDNVVMPVGHGTNMAGMYRGFKTLLQRGLIPRMPRIFAAQAASIAPLVQAFERGDAEPMRVEPFKTVAEGIAISRPAHGIELLRAIRETGGAAVGVSEDEIHTARTDLAMQGIFIEPTSATAVAVLTKNADQLREDELTVVSLTGSGLKSPL